MLYLNQLDYKEIPYAHNLDHGGPPEGKGNVAAAGCGPCCLCMAVENLTLCHYDLMDCLKLAGDLGATRGAGTNLKILGPAVAEKFGLNFETTNSLERLKAHLRDGGMAVANSGGDREGYTGVFSHGGHYILVVSTDGREACILDPSYKEGKYGEAGRENKAVLSGGFVYCSLEVLEKDCANRDPAFYLFSRKR